MSHNIKIAVILINYNSSDFLKKALDALAKQTFKNFKVIIFDNASLETVSEDILPKGLDTSIIHSPQNLGFAAGNNRAIDQASDCDWIALLNPDAFPEPEWLEKLSHAIVHSPEFAFFASKLLKAGAKDIFDGSGDEYHVSGRAWRRDFQRPNNKQREIPEEVFAPCAAAAIYRRDAWLAAGGLDENYFCYFEDVDLAFRLRLLGYRCQYVPDAIAHHVGSAITQRHSDFYIYHGQRNMIWTYVKNMPGFLFWFYLPWHITLNITAILLFLFKGRGKIILKAKLDACKGLSRVMKERKYWQSRRVLSAWSLRKMLSKGLPWQKK